MFWVRGKEVYRGEEGGGTGLSHVMSGCQVTTGEVQGVCICWSSTTNTWSLIPSCKDDPLISDAEFDAKMRASVKEKLNIVEEFESEEQRSLRRRWGGSGCVPSENGGGEGSCVICWTVVLIV